jgi:cyclopropane fatty-acyl-phospholipid synthase-like methyltransferase
LGVLAFLREAASSNERMQTDWPPASPLMRGIIQGKHTVTIDRFANKADSYEQNQSRVENVANIASSVLNAIEFNQSMHIMDFGSGTGLLLEKIASYVGKITAVDISRSMNQQLEEKRSRLGCKLDILEIDLEKSTIPLQVDGIISSMTMHHVENIKAMFDKFYSMVKPDGFIAIADLDIEDGSFHTEDTGVFHHGFDRDEFARVTSEAGFEFVRVSSASVVHKPQGKFEVFLLTAVRPAHV